ncbi:leucine rich adaptor protein 1-like [Astyanax mexicanus]|uniref:Leucine rich adaptor protein 1-like n=2 Tax=Astyanax mexicanus TaxID=7994 RepID=A0A8B9RI93_ASTMX|nr:leucine rich adaptor protein 1-like [Astyanax mexicanus]KAG9259911.1 leucine rich adaptor protein 1-like [Astyanax mexicanus]
MEEEESTAQDFKEIEQKLGRKVPQSLVRSIAEHKGKVESRLTSPSRKHSSSSSSTNQDLKRLESKMILLKQEMANLRAIDVKLMQQLLSINEGIESIRWVMDERGGVASRESSLNGSLYSLTDSPDASLHGSFSSLHDRTDELDGISVGSYLDTLGEDLADHPSPTELSGSFSDKPIIEDDTFKKSPLRPRVDSDEYYCFG